MNFFVGLFFAFIQPPQAPVLDLPEPSADMPVVLPALVELNVGRAAKIDAKALGPITWASYPGIRSHCDVFGFEKSVIFASDQAGVYWIGASCVNEGKASLPVWVMVKVGIPPPVPPVPPAPPEPPVPPIPPAPIPEAGLHVLIIYDQIATLGKEQQAILFTAQVRSYLNAKTPLGPDGKTREWRFWASSVNPAGDPSPVWAKAFARPRGKAPWIIISNGKTGFEGQLPASVSETMSLLQKYGG